MRARRTERRDPRAWIEALAFSGLLLACPAAAADRLAGQVLGGGAPIGGSTVTLWAAGAGEPKQLATAQSDTKGRFELHPGAAPGKDAVLYLLAKGGQPSASKAGGDNPAVALIAILGSKPPPKVVINEFTSA